MAEINDNFSFNLSKGHKWVGICRLLTFYKKIRSEIYRLRANHNESAYQLPKLLKKAKNPSIYSVRRPASISLYPKIDGQNFEAYGPKFLLTNPVLSALWV